MGPFRRFKASLFQRFVGPKALLGSPPGFSKWGGNNPGSSPQNLYGGDPRRSLYRGKTLPPCGAQLFSFFVVLREGFARAGREALLNKGVVFPPNEGGDFTARERRYFVRGLLRRRALSLLRTFPPGGCFPPRGSTTWGI